MATRHELFGVSASRQLREYVNSYTYLLNPNRLSVEQGDRFVNWDTIGDDDQIISCTQQRFAGVKSMLHEIQGSDQQLTDFISGIFETLNVREAIENMLKTALYGYCMHEVLWWFDESSPSLDSGLIKPIKISTKPSEWFVFDENNLPRFLTLDNAQGIPLPPKKFLITRYEPTYKNPYGTSLLSKCLWYVLFKRCNLAFWLKFAEKYGMPHFVGKTDQGSDQEIMDALLDTLDSLTQDGVAVTDKENEIEAVNAATSYNTEIYDTIMKFLDKGIAKVILSQTLTTDIGSNGSYAASQTHADVAKTIIDSDVSMIEEAFNRLIQWTVDVNFGPQKEYPKFVLYRPKDVDGELADVVSKLSASGVSFTKQFYINRFGFKEEEFTINALPQAQQVGSKKALPPAFTEFEGARFSDQELIDAFAERTIDKGTPLFIALADELNKLIGNYASFDECKSNIAKLIPRLDTRSIEEKLTNVLFMADVIGRLSVQKEQANG